MTAVVFLKNKKYQILATNVRSKNYELDIVALDTALREIVFIEVKTRSSEFFGLPTQAVGYKKFKSLRIAAFAYLQAQQLDNSFRFDIISVLPGKIEHYENVTW